MHIIGEVAGRSCILIDDMVDTANTLCEAAAALKRHGAVKVLACCTHPVLSGEATTRIANSQLDELLVTNSIPLRRDALACPMTQAIERGRIAGRIDPPPSRRGIPSAAFSSIDATCNLQPTNED